MKKNEPRAATKRQYARLDPESIPAIKGISLSQGRASRIVNISRGGALIETDVRLCPQTKIGFKVLLASGDVRVTGSVNRSFIKSLKDAPIYRCAVVFENPLAVPDVIEPAGAIVK